MRNLETSKQDGNAIREAMETASARLHTLQTQRNTTLSSMQAAVDGYFDPLIKAACEELQRKREELLHCITYMFPAGNLIFAILVRGEELKALISSILSKSASSVGNIP